MGVQIYAPKAPGEGPVHAGAKGDAAEPGHDFPVLTAKDLEQANELFDHFVFYRREKKYLLLWTSCCFVMEQRYDVVQRTMDDRHASFISSKHNDLVKCPYCGKTATLKSIGKIGKRGLEEFIPVLFLGAGARGELYAQGYWVRKAYNFRNDPYDDKLNMRATFKLTEAYKFEPGRARMWTRTYDEDIGRKAWIVTEEPGRRKITEPFTKGSYMFTEYVDYYVIGMEAIQRSAFKYCQYEDWLKMRRSKLYPSMKNEFFITHRYLMRWLAASSLYPRMVEMLYKSGMDVFVTDLIENRRKNSEIVNWEARNQREAFKIPRQEVLRLMGGRKNIIRVLETLRRFKRKRLCVTIQEAADLYENLDYRLPEFIDACAENHLAPMVLHRYIRSFSGVRCHGGGVTEDYVFTVWRDYVSAARAIGYDLGAVQVLMPRRLEEAHNNAVAERNRRNAEAEAARKEAYLKAHPEEAARLAREAEEAKKLISKRVKNYTCEIEGYVIRPAASGEEIIAEGNVLSHCVRGYAERHMTGKLTICFLRMADAPDTPMVTIELNTAGKMVQCHGYRNDQGTEPAGKTYAHILTPWLKWISEGSKRDKDGNPVLDRKPRKKKEGHAA